MVNEHERDLFGRVCEYEIQSCEMKYSWISTKRPATRQARIQYRRMKPCKQAEYYVQTSGI